MKKTIGVLGLGIFGSTLAKDLSKYNMDVIAVDRHMKNVEKVSEFVSNALCFDFTDVDQLKAAGLGDADIVVITCETSLEDEILATIACKEMGIKKVIVKAKDSLNSDVLKKIGADVTISPEKEVAEKTAKMLVSNNVLELFDVDNKNTIFNITLPKSWINKTLVDLQLRKKHGINVVGVRRNGSLIVNFDPNIPFEKTDEVLIIGEKDLFDKFDKLFK